MAVEVTCAGCGEVFEAQRRSAKWCSNRCRQSGQQADRAEEHEKPREPSGLVTSVTRDLERAEALDTFAGQLALQLAKRLSTPEESGISSLSKELRTVMAAALAGRTPPTAEAEPEDEVEKARRRRDEKSRAAAG